MSKSKSQYSKNYQRGVRWGKKIFRNNVREYGEVGVHKSDKASETCYKYAHDLKTEKTKTGKILTKRARAFYAGVANGVLAAYNSHK